MNSDPSNDDSTLERLRAGGTGALARVFDELRPRLTRLVRLRLDARLSQRMDASDVIQEAYLEASRRIASYLESPGLPPYVWLRSLTLERILNLHRRHLGAQRRSARRELPAQSSFDLGRTLMALQATPSQEMMREELCRQVQESLDALPDDDREVLLLRHFEGLSNGEVALILGLTKSGASMRYGRALYRLRRHFTDVISRDRPQS